MYGCHTTAFGAGQRTTMAVGTRVLSGAGTGSPLIHGDPAGSTGIGTAAMRIGLQCGMTTGTATITMTDITVMVTVGAGCLSIKTNSETGTFHKLPEEAVPVIQSGSVLIRFKRAPELPAEILSAASTAQQTQKGRPVSKGTNPTPKSPRVPFNHRAPDSHFLHPAIVILQ